MTATPRETGTPDLQASLESGILTLTLNRPDTRNAMSEAMVVALGQQLAWAERSAEVRCVVLTGAGSAFCAGGDVKGMTQPDGAPSAGDTLDEQIHRQRLNQRATAGRLFHMPKPTLAVLPGAAAGAGLALALACDLRIMSDDAVLITAFARVGLSGDYGGAFFLTQLVGAAKARELYYLSDRVSAETALALGLTNWISPPDRLSAAADALAGRLAAGPAVAFRYMKENLNRALAGDLLACMDVEATHHIHCGQTDDHRDAARAFVEKRPPTFKGR